MAMYPNQIEEPYIPLFQEPIQKLSFKQSKLKITLFALYIMSYYGLG